MVDVDAVVVRLEQPGFAVQFVGEKGYGKTTHLLAIRSRFANAGYVHIPEGERAAMPTGCPLLIDEAQRLTFWQRIRLFRSNTPLVLGTHRDFSNELRRAGRFVETIDVQQGTDVERLIGLLNARIVRARRNDGPVPVITRDTARELLRKFGPNIRAALHDLYVTFQSLSDVCDV